MLGAASEAWFGYRDQRLHLNEILQAESRSAAERIQDYIDGIRDQLGLAVQFPWIEGQDDRHRIDALRLLQQMPAIVSIALVDQTGTERVFTSRLSLNRIGRGADMSADPAGAGARDSKVWYGPVRYQQGCEPYMRISVAGNLACAGIVVAGIGLKRTWDGSPALQSCEPGPARR